jgi:hypothetical protein
MKRSFRLLICCLVLGLAALAGVAAPPAAEAAAHSPLSSVVNANPCCPSGACTFCHGRGVCDDGACTCICR